MMCEPLFDIQVTRDDTHLIPKMIGIYFLYSDDRQLLYIGKSINIKMRIREHLKSFAYKGSPDYNKYIFYIGVIQCSIEQLDVAEIEMINKHRPLFNIKDASYINEVKIPMLNNHLKSSIKKCKYLYTSLDACNLYSLEDGYCFLHSPTVHYHPWIVKGKLVTSEMNRLLYGQTKKHVKHGMYFFMSKKTFIKLAEENSHLDMDIQGSDGYLKFRRHNIVIDDIHEIRISRYQPLTRDGDVP